MKITLRGFEYILKWLDEAAVIAEYAAVASPGLNDRVSCQRVQRSLQDARRTLRRIYYPFEDALTTMQNIYDEDD